MPRHLRLALFALLCAPHFAGPNTARAQEPPALAERAAPLPAEPRAQWRAYLSRSEALRAAEAHALREEAGEAKPQKAPAGKDFKIDKKWTNDWFGTDEAQRLTQAILSFQTPSGGWSKAVDYSKGPRAKGMQWTSQSSPFHYAATFDNRATTEQVEFLLRAQAHSPRQDVRQDVRRSIERALDYVLAAQFPSGGWPQVFPLEGGYHDAVTFNDNALVHILELLRGVSREPRWAWLDEARRAKAGEALARGIECVLRSQFVRGGRKTAWCAQHDPISLLPVRARRMEPASLSGGESVGIVRFLMQEDSAPAIAESIEAALRWFEESKITGLKEVERDGKRAYERRDTPQEPLWARFCDLETNRPLFAGGQDGVLYGSYAEMAARNGVGYDYFVTSPRELLARDAPKWRARLKAEGTRR